MDSNIGVINEEWIIKKLNINHENFEDIKVICLPGTYQEKVTKLGNSLHKFTRLKELDLSRNALISLEGIEHLKYLEKLNLYYNNVSSMKELERLRHNTTLSELDLRLNPITKQENDYRLFLIYLLPSLKVLDDRAVRDSERQMAFSLFEPLVTNSLTSANLYDKNGLAANPIASRVKSVTNIAMRSAGITDLNDDNAAFLNQQRLYENANNSSLSNEDVIKKPQAEEYSLNELKEIASIDLQNYNVYNQNRLQNDSAKELNRAKSSSMSNLKMNGFDANRDNCTQKGNKSVHFNEYPAYHGQNLADSDFTDEREAFNSFKSRGNFTPNPYYDQDERDMNCKNRTDKESLDEIEGEWNDLNKKGDPLFILLDLVDRYWNGSKSLHKNIKFLGAANHLILNCCKMMNSDVNINQTESTHSYHQQIKTLQEENRRLNDQVQQLKLKNSMNPIAGENQQQYNSLTGELDSLKKKLIACQEENKTLRKELNEKVDKYSNLDSIENQNNNMRRDIEIMRIKLKQFEQLQQLTSMLQESHKSLVTTNEHLLQEVNNHKQFLKANCNNSGSLPNGHQTAGHFQPHNQRHGGENIIYSPSQMSNSGIHEFQLMVNMPNKHLIGPAFSGPSSLRKQFEQFK